MRKSLSEIDALLAALKAEITEHEDVEEQAGFGHPDCLRTIQAENRRMRYAGLLAERSFLTRLRRRVLQIRKEARRRNES